MLNFIITMYNGILEGALTLVSFVLLLLNTIFSLILSLLPNASTVLGSGYDYDTVKNYLNYPFVIADKLDLILPIRETFTIGLYFFFYWIAVYIIYFIWKNIPFKK